AVAAGAGIPIAPGIVASHRYQAVDAIEAQLCADRQVMVKLDFAAGGYGNEILTRTPGVHASGALNVVALPNVAAVTGYVDERWSWLTGGRDDRLVIERFVPDATTVYAEFTATDDGCVLHGMGEILMEPVRSARSSRRSRSGRTRSGRSCRSPNASASSSAAWGTAATSAQMPSSRRPARWCSPRATVGSRPAPTCTATSWRASWGRNGATSGCSWNVAAA